jgi:hypothetical protein
MGKAKHARGQQMMTNTAPLTMNLSKENSWEYHWQQQAIDAEIKSLEDSIHVLKRRHNVLAPISSLPAEVISAIFFLLRKPGSSASGWPKLVFMLCVAQVCHQWREISLDRPVLWSHLDFTTVSPAGATEILARARMTPLSLEANIPSDCRWDDARFFSFQKELQNHISHIYHLNLNISAEPFLTSQPKDSYCLLPFSKPFHFPLRSASMEQHLKYLYLILYSTGLHLGSLPSSSAIAISVGNRHSSKVSKTSR